MNFTQRLLLAVALLCGTAFSSATVAPLHATPSTWLDARGLPLRMDEDAVLEMLRTARVVDQKTLKTGINRTLKLTLEQDGVQIHAAFRTVDVELPPRHRDSRPNRFTFRDHYQFEVAAYRLSRLLGLDRVPPTVLRKLGSTHGSAQLWVERAQTEAELRSSEGSRPTAQLQVQKQTMKVFDQLIYNFDRHLNNFLIDGDGKLWMIDHTRSFKKLPELSKLNQLVTCDRGFYQSLRDVPEARIQEELRDLLGAMELDAVLKRRRMILKRFERLIAERGEEYVLHSLGPLPSRSRLASLAVDGWAQRLEQSPRVRVSV